MTRHLTPTPLEYNECIVFKHYLELLQTQGKVIKYSHIPEMHTMSHAQRAKNVAQGFHAGMPDYVIILKNGKIVWIEMKRAKGGKVSDEQYEWQEALQSAGQVAEICYGAESAIDVVKDNL